MTMPLITGPDALVLMLHEEMRSWLQQGVAFVLADDGAITILAESRELNRKAQDYRSQNAEALRRYLAFVQGRDPDDAIRHLDFAWHLRGAMATDEWKPVRVMKIDKELSHEEQRLTGLERDVVECKDRIQTLKKDREAELKHEATGG